MNREARSNPRETHAHRQAESSNKSRKAKFVSAPTNGKGVRRPKAPSNHSANASRSCKNARFSGDEALAHGIRT